MALQVLSTRPQICRANYVVSNNIGIIRNRTWPAKKISLDLIALRLFEKCVLSRRLDALSQNWNTEAPAKTNYRSNDRHRMVVALQVRNEGAIDLYFIERKSVQVR